MQWLPVPAEPAIMRSPENPHHSIAYNFQHHLSVKVWREIIHDQFFRPFFLEMHLPADYYLHFLLADNTSFWKNFLFKLD
jgi:hypothetical protein